MSKSFTKQVAAKIESLTEEVESMRAARDMAKSQAARDAITVKIEYAENNRRLLRGF